MRTLNTHSGRTESFSWANINDYPDYQTQAYSKDELVENLRDLLTDIESGKVPFV